MPRIPEQVHIPILPEATGWIDEAAHVGNAIKYVTATAERGAWGVKDWTIEGGASFTVEQLQRVRDQLIRYDRERESFVPIHTNWAPNPWGAVYDQEYLAQYREELKKVHDTLILGSFYGNKPGTKRVDKPKSWGPVPDSGRPVFEWNRVWVGDVASVQLPDGSTADLHELDTTNMRVCADNLTEHKPHVIAEMAPVAVDERDTIDNERLLGVMVRRDVIEFKPTEHLVSDQRFKLWGSLQKTLAGSNIVVTLNLKFQCLGTSGVKGRPELGSMMVSKSKLATWFDEIVGTRKPAKAEEIVKIAHLNNNVGFDDSDLFDEEP